jgi:hypothetical protein
MGERVGGKNPKDWYRDRFGNVSWHDSQEDQIKGKNGETLTRLGKSGSYINNRGTVTDLNKDRTVTESGKTSFILQPSPMSASAMYGDDSPQISSPGKPTTYLSSFDTTKYYPLATQKLQSPALVDPSASIMKAYIEGEAGVYLFRGFGSILFYERSVAGASEIGMRTLSKQEMSGVWGKGSDYIYQDYDQARNAALKWLDGQGFKAEKQVLGKFGTSEGKAIGMKNGNGNIGFRVEYDARSGAHINVFSGKLKGPHFQFNASEKTVNQIITRFSK